MSVTWKREWSEISDRLVERGLFETADQAADAAFALLRAEADKHAWLKARIDEALAEDDWLSPEELRSELDAHFGEIEKQGFR